MVGIYRKNDRDDAPPTDAVVRMSLRGAVHRELAEIGKLGVEGAIAMAMVGVVLLFIMLFLGLEWLGPLGYLPIVLRVWRRVRGRWLW